MTHRIEAISLSFLTGCSGCGPTSPHNVSVRCACRPVPPLAIIAGKTDHIWTVTLHGDGTGSLSPSYVFPEHAHEFVQRVPIVSEAQLHLVEVLS